ncbi:hypothetical protein T484DRAFT_1930667 [Baffinella frigidus]|nr:hypothetical protein T484DRAFT_1930667 [Cryptophyta sp. CCMP2293]|mmetsp:Transcript_19484/g.47179  ORF Transcript_19484/g.47179 Transcript_19484/m.47179 type:complete len:221 (-) Transcript_19484:230-892(-)
MGNQSSSEQKEDGGQWHDTILSDLSGGKLNLMQSFDDAGMGGLGGANRTLSEESERQVWGNDAASVASAGNDAESQGGGELANEQLDRHWEDEKVAEEEERLLKFEESKDNIMRADYPAAALRRATGQLSQVMGRQEIWELQEQEQQRAQDLQRRAIEKVLMDKHAKISSKGKHDVRVMKAIKEAKNTAYGVYEYSTHSAYIFGGFESHNKLTAGGGKAG